LVVQLRFDCPKCLQSDGCDVTASTTAVACRHCGWTRGIDPGVVSADVPRQCLVCGCDDLWRQKDFPAMLGLVMVGLGIGLSSIAVAYFRPVLALGILMAFALADMLLFAVMRDALVCYRCHARYRNTGALAEQPRFNLELNERYRQEAARLKTDVARQATRTP
jgi:ribosomal protein L40E